jgi:hypothetical protein
MTPDQRLDRVAEGQLGPFTLPQALDAGFTADVTGRTPGVGFRHLGVEKGGRLAL